MRHALPALALCLVAAASTEASDEAIAFVAPERPRTSAYVGEVVELSVGFRVDDEGSAREFAPLFQQPSDLPLRLTTPWARLPEGARALVASPQAEAGATMVVDDAVRRVRSTFGGRSSLGRTWRGFETSTALVFDRPGLFRLEPATLRCALAQRFEQDALGRRVPVGVRQVTVRGEPIEIEVRPLPTQGRPPGFAGAVGRFDAQVRLIEPTTDAPRSARVEVALTGDGDLSLFRAPTADDMDGLHLLGLLEQSAPGRRTFVLELAPGRGRPVLPPLLFPHYELGAVPGYRVAATSTLPLPMLEDAGAPAAPPRATEPTSDPPPEPKPWWAILGLLAVLVLMGRLRRRGASDAATAAADRDRRAALRARLLAPGADLAGAFAEVLAARLGTPPAAVVAPDLAGRLERAGVAPEPAREAAAAMERLVGARYGGVEAPPGAEELVALAERVG